MTNFRPWAAWRRLYYGTGASGILAIVGVLTYFMYFYVPPNCFDSVQNAGERGVDCGGACVRICAFDVLKPELQWADSFEIQPGQYNAVAYVENKNPVAATPVLNYTFELINNGVVVATRAGQTILPPNSTYPIFEGRIFTTNQLPVTETRITLEPVDLWLPASAGREQFRTSNIRLTGADASPRLDVAIENTALVDATDVEVVATIFNQLGEPVTASQTFIDRLRSRRSETVVFTWPNEIAKTVRSCEVPTDVIVAIDLSGSMNNDSDNPPQPVTDAITAAAQFVTQLKSRDLVGVVTFATAAELVSPLTSSVQSIAATIRSLTIDPASEQGFTNTTEALRLAATELQSDRHNPDARRVIVLLTDGLPTAPGQDDVSTEAVAAAQAVRAGGTLIYAIGLGSGVDRAFIEQLAADPAKAYIAPSSRDLASIYAAISTDLCEVGPTRVEVIPKTRTSFAPLR